MNHKLFLSYWQKGLYLLFVAALIVGSMVTVQPTQNAFAASELTPDLKSRQVITVQALIDGRSHLFLRKTSAQWHHLDFAAPGRHEFVDIPTYIQGKKWFPLWPDVPDAENRDCDCYSSIFRKFRPGIAWSTKLSAEIKVVQGRGTVSIVEYPSKANKYVFVIEFDDNAYDGSTLYKIQIVLRSGKH